MNIQTDDACRQEFQNLKYKKEKRYIIYQIKEERISVEHVGDRAEKWETFIQRLPEKQYRYCVFDFEFTNEDHMKVTKLIFVHWAPDSTPIGKRMIYATGKESFKKYLDILGKEVTINAKGDVIINLCADDLKGHGEGTVQMRTLQWQL